jgi:hypothetical protein
MRRRRRRAGQPAALRATTRAAVSARTSRTPASRSTLAHASSVAAVVDTSSTSTTILPSTLACHGICQGHRLRASANACRTFARRAEAARATCGLVARTRARAGQTAMPRCAASNDAWLNPRRHFRVQCNGTGIAASTPHNTSFPLAVIIAASRGATERRLSYFSTWTITRSVPAYSPTARLRAMSDGPRRQRGHAFARPEGRLSCVGHQSGAGRVQD